MEHNDYNPETQLLNQITLERLLWKLTPSERSLLVEHYVLERPLEELRSKYEFTNSKQVTNKVRWIVYKLRKLSLRDTI